MSKVLHLRAAFMDALHGYKKNWMVLTAVGLLLGVLCVVDKKTNSYMHVARTFIKHELLKSSHIEEFRDKVISFFSHNDTMAYTGKQQIMHVALLLVMLYCFLGLVQLCLGLTSKKKAGLETFVVSPLLYVRAIGGILVVAFLAVSMFVLSFFGLQALTWLLLPNSLMLVIAFGALLTIVIFTMRYSFLLWALVDGKAALMKALQNAAKMMEGNTGRLLAYMLLWYAFLVTFATVVHMILTPLVKMMPLMGLSYVAIHMVTMPLFFMGMTSAYRQLK